jgi:hypothetical protein
VLVERGDDLVSAQLRPPLMVVKTSRFPSCRTNPLTLEMGTTTVPLGSTTGLPPTPWNLLAVATGADQVLPPLVDVLISTRKPLLTTSHSA